MTMPERYNYQATKSNSDWVSCSHFYHTDNFLLITTTALNLGQGHGKVIPYIYSDLVFFFVSHI